MFTGYAVFFVVTNVAEAFVYFCVSNSPRDAVGLLYRYSQTR